MNRLLADHNLVIITKNNPTEPVDSNNLDTADIANITDTANSKILAVVTDLAIQIKVKAGKHQVRAALLSPA